MIRHGWLGLDQAYAVYPISTIALAALISVVPLAVIVIQFIDHLKAAPADGGPSRNAIPDRVAGRRRCASEHTAEETEVGYPKLKRREHDGPF